MPDYYREPDPNVNPSLKKDDPAAMPFGPMGGMMPFGGMDPMFGMGGFGGQHFFVHHFHHHFHHHFFHHPFFPFTTPFGFGGTQF